jgi:hypothetical protein
MSGTVSLYDTRDLIGVLRQMKPARSWLLDTFAKRTKVHTTKSFDIDIIKGTRRVAPYVRPILAGKVMDREGFSTNSYTPPTIKPIMTMGPEDLGHRQAGNTIYENNMSPAQMASAAVGRYLADMETAITRAEEIQMSMGLQTGKVTITGDGYNGMEIDFLMPAGHKVTLLTTERWGQTTGTPMANLETWCQLVALDSGIFPNIAIFGATAWADFKKREVVAGGTFDMLKVNMGQINPKLLPNGVKYLGYLAEQNLDCYQYVEYYQDANGVTQPMISPNSVILGHDDVEYTRHYGLIEDLEVSGALKRFPSNWIERNPSRLMVQLQSAPLMAMHQSDAFFVATVN